ncbi:unnamed protein product [Protopolystoma xenopodis]|uniref:Uncharacterized protein n=1 Tax=Protopolystoma xenopodis TaxID=117903 RepID=A0A3S5AYF7_9PLAT|nr:unnamed protein product [Protopolystoma xenopodis]
MAVFYLRIKSGFRLSLWDNIAIIHVELTFISSGRDSKLGSTRRPAVDWLYCNIHADAVSEAIPFDSGDLPISSRNTFTRNGRSAAGARESVRLLTRRRETAEHELLLAAGRSTPKPRRQLASHCLRHSRAEKREQSETAAVKCSLRSQSRLADGRACAESESRRRWPGRLFPSPRSSLRLSVSPLVPLPTCTRTCARVCAHLLRSEESETGPHATPTAVAHFRVGHFAHQTGRIHADKVVSPWDGLQPVGHQPTNAASTQSIGPPDDTIGCRVSRLAGLFVSDTGSSGRGGAGEGKCFCLCRTARDCVQYHTPVHGPHPTTGSSPGRASSSLEPPQRPVRLGSCGEA